MSNFFNKFKYPEVPNVPKNDHGWFPKWNEELLVPLVTNKLLIVELGSWLGKSTRYWLNNSRARVSCIDTWLGSMDHQGREDVKDKLPTLYETFLVNQSDFKERVYPLRASTIKGMLEVAKSSLEPDFIYIDADHSYEAVFSDLTVAYSLFPDALICGDDWNWKNRNQGKRKTVQEAVKEFCKVHKKEYVNNHWAWYIKELK
jgi:hypothetical protein